jgi:hypothetical protein
MFSGGVSMAERQTDAAGGAGPVMVEARDLSKVFRDFWRRRQVRAVNGLSFDVLSLVRHRPAGA